MYNIKLPRSFDSLTLPQDDKFSTFLKILFNLRKTCPYSASEVLNIMSDNKRPIRGNKGYYIALILCAAAIGITGYVYYRNDSPVEEAALEETYQDILVGTVGSEDIPVIATQPPAQTTTPPTQATTPAPTVKKSFKVVSPVSGEEIFGYSMEALSYNQTTRDWRVHNGIDLAAEEGAPVCAAADGQIYKVYEDETLGHTVIIRHADGYTTCYGSLSETAAVNTGDFVNAGQTIGYAADSAIVETTLGSHVHFSVTQYDEPMDPADFLALSE